MERRGPPNPLFHANTRPGAPQFRGFCHMGGPCATVASSSESRRPVRPISVYVHFPWCLKKCPYCDFVSFAKPRDEIEHRRYADAVLAELEARAGALSGRRLETVFFGGGTPSLWDPRELGRV